MICHRGVYKVQISPLKTYINIMLHGDLLTYDIAMEKSGKFVIVLASPRFNAIAAITTRAAIADS